MATKVEKDEVTGHVTTGHVWDGIRELDRPLPRWWLYVFYACIAWSVVYWVLYPSWPGISGYFGGIIGSNQRLQLDGKIEQARALQAVYLERIDAAEPAEIQADGELSSFALAGGQAAFADNCVPCHGLGGGGNEGYPSLADDSWIWGGTLEDIRTTLEYGIRADNDESRFSDMPAFGAMDILEPQDVDDVATFVLALGGKADDVDAAGRGAVLFEENCAACHGEQGEGDNSVGAPSLNDAIWLYGGSKADIVAQVDDPRHGVMPAWGGRLDASTIKMLTVYVHGLGGGQ